MVLLRQPLGQHVDSWLFLKQKALGITDTLNSPIIHRLFFCLGNFPGKEAQILYPGLDELVWFNVDSKSLGIIRFAGIEVQYLIQGHREGHFGDSCSFV